MKQNKKKSREFRRIKDDPGVSGVESKSGKVVGVLSDYINYARDSLDQKLYFNLVQFDSENEQIQMVCFL